MYLLYFTFPFPVLCYSSPSIGSIEDTLLSLVQSRKISYDTYAIKYYIFCLSILTKLYFSLLAAFI